MKQRRRMAWIMGLGLLALVAWFILPVLLPEQALTQRPREFTEPQPATETPLSHVSLDLVLPLSELEKHLTREVDASLARNNEDKDFKAWRSGPVRLQAHGRKLELTLPLGFKNRSGPDTKGSLVVLTRITAGIAPDWQPQVTVNSDFNWVRKPKVRLLGVKVRVSGVIGRAIKRKLRDLDTKLREEIESALTLKPRAEDWWQSLHQPEQLAENPPVWLAVEPRALFFEAPNGDGRTLRLGVGVRAKLATSIVARPAPTPMTDLPSLAQASASDRGFVLYLPVMADYEGLAAELREKLVGRRIPLEQGAITPRDFTLYTSGRSLVIGVDFHGDAPGFLLDTSGTVFFTGEPQFDPQSQVLRVENFRFTRRLNNPLLSAGTWVLQESLRLEMQQQLVWHLGGRLEEGAGKLSAQLNKPLSDDMQMVGQVEKLAMTDIAFRAEGIHIGLEAHGHLKVTLMAARADPG